VTVQPSYVFMFYAELDLWKVLGGVGKLEVVEKAGIFCFFVCFFGRATCIVNVRVVKRDVCYDNCPSVCPSVRNTSESHLNCSLYENMLCTTR